MIRKSNLFFLLITLSILLVVNFSLIAEDDMYDEEAMMGESDSMMDEGEMAEDEETMMGEDTASFDLALWPAEQYMADFKFMMQGVNVNHRQYVGDHRKRIEIYSDTIQSVIISIYKTEEVQTIYLYPEEKQYIQETQPYSEYLSMEEDLLISPYLPGDEIEEQIESADYSSSKIGSEEMLGRTVEVWSIKSMVEGEEMEMKAWIDRELRQILKQEIDGQVLLEVTNLEVGPQPDNLFEIPEGYQSMY